MGPKKSPGVRALILLADLVRQVDAASANFLVRKMIDSSTDAQRTLKEARAILAAAKEELR
jgi:hypothetical protein